MAPDRPECALNNDDLKKVVKRPEAFTVAGVKGKAGGERSRGDEQVNRPGASNLTSGGDNRSENATVCSCAVPVEWECIEHSFSPLKAILSPGPLVRIRARWGPAASSAMVSALTETSTASCVESSRSRSITTEVSSTPRDGRGRSATRSRFLTGDAVQISAKAPIIDRRRGLEQGDRRLGRDEAMTSQWRELTDGYAVSSHDQVAP